MGEKQSHAVSLAGDQANGRAIPPSGKRGGRLAFAVLSMAAVLGHATNPAGSARAQDTPAKNDAAAKTDAIPGESTPDSPSQEPEAASAEALSVRYRFIERYSPTEDPDHPERITQYRVGLRETQKTEREKQQGAPDSIPDRMANDLHRKSGAGGQTGGTDERSPTLRQVPDERNRRPPEPPRSRYSRA